MVDTNCLGIFCSRRCFLSLDRAGALGHQGSILGVLLLYILLLLETSDLLIVYAAYRERKVRYTAALPQLGIPVSLSMWVATGFWQCNCG